MENVGLVLRSSTQAMFTRLATRASEFGPLASFQTRGREASPVFYISFQSNFVASRLYKV